MDTKEPQKISSNTPKRILKIAFICMFVAVSLLIISCAVLITYLPSPSEINAVFSSHFSDSSEKSDPGVLTENKSNSLEMKAKNSQVSKITPLYETDEWKKNWRKRKLRLKTIAKYLIKRFEEQNEVKICQHFDLIGHDGITNSQEFEEALHEAAIQNNFKNPLLESILAPIDYVLTFPSIRTLTKTVVEDEGRNKHSGFLEKMKFYSNIVEAGLELVRRKKEIERVSDKSYQLFTLSKAVQRKHSLASDSSVQKFCNEIQASMIDWNSSRDIGEENKEMLKFLKYSNLLAEEVGFDSNYKTDLKVITSKHGLIMEIGWLESIFKARN